MATLKILIFPDPKLRTVADRVKEVSDSIVKLSEDMLETMYEGDGVGLAATQVDVHKRIIVIDVSKEKNDPLVLINPTINRIINNENKSYSEGCLSVPGIYEELERPTSVEINALGIDGKEFTLVAEDILSVVIQHEMDHLEGKMMVDYLSNLKREMIRKKMIKQKASK
jgi:peptide deformylase